MPLRCTGICLVCVHWGRTAFSFHLMSIGGALILDSGSNLFLNRWENSLMTSVISFPHSSGGQGFSSASSSSSSWSSTSLASVVALVLLTLGLMWGQFWGRYWSSMRSFHDTRHGSVKSGDTIASIFLVVPSMLLMNMVVIPWVFILFLAASDKLMSASLSPLSLHL